MTEIQHWKESDFREKGQQGTILIDFFGEWCGPCKQMGSVLESAAAELPESLTIAKIDIADAPVLAAEWKVNSIPALFLLQNGKEIASHIGTMDKEALLAFLKKHV